MTPTSGPGTKGNGGSAGRQVRDGVTGGGAPMLPAARLTLRRLDPRGVGGLLERPTDLLRLAGTLRRRRVVGIALDAGGALASDLEGWRVALAPTRLVAAACVRVDQLEPAAIATLAADGPLLLILQPAPVAPRRSWLAARAFLAGARLAGLRVAVDGPPPCLRALGPGDLHVRIEPQAGAGGHYGSACGICAARGECRGLPAAVESDDLEAITRAISNQVDGTPTEASLEPGGCALLAGMLDPGQDAVRLLVVGEGRGRRAWRVTAPGWTGAELDTVIDRRGQVYLDVSSKPRLDDFAADLRALVRTHPPHPESTGVCPGGWAVRDEPPFAAEEAALVARLASLRGTVIDIGAGPIRYLRLLAEHMRAGRVRYIAIDPDAVTLHRMRTELAGAAMAVGQGERLPIAGGCADALLMLRSWNHLADVGAALAEAARVLRPGGRMIIVDNVAFVLLRSADQIERAHAISVERTPFEHHRNDDATDAVAAIGRDGRFEIVDVAAVGPTTSNQWLVEARRV